MIRKIIGVLFISFLFVGCARNMHHVQRTIDHTKLSENNATVIVVIDGSGSYSNEILLDKKKVGILTSGNELKFAATPGEHIISPDIYSDGISVNFKEGKVHYMKVWLNKGIFSGRYEIKEISKIDTFTEIIVK